MDITIEDTKNQKVLDEISKKRLAYEKEIDERAKISIHLQSCIDSRVCPKCGGTLVKKSRWLASSMLICDCGWKHENISHGPIPPP